MAEKPHSGRRTSLHWRLPVLVCGLVLAIVAGFSALGYLQVERALIGAGHARLQGAADQLSSMMAASFRQRLDEARKLAASPDVRAILATPSDETRERATSAMTAAVGKQPVVIEVWSSTGARLLDVITPAARTAGVTAPRDAAPARAGLSSLIGGDRKVFYQVVADIRSGDAPSSHLGFLVVTRAMAAAGVDTISRLIGPDAAIRIGDPQAGVSMDLSTLTLAPMLNAGGHSEYRDGEGTRRVAATSPIADSLWVVAVELPREVVVGPARSFLLNRAVLALPFLIIALVMTRLLIARITAPLVELTEAAEAIAGGDYSKRVRTGRVDEIGRLGESFNTMTARVEEGVHQLEDRVRDRTRELEEAMAALKDAQEDAVRREKLAMLGQLASGVGHELRNPLGVMTNAVYYLEMIQTDADPEVRDYLGILRGQIGIADRIVTDLLDFARVKPPQVREVALERLVDEQVSRLGPLNGVTLERDFPAGLPPAMVDSGQMGQIVLNLLINAVQAMEEGGTLSVRGRTMPGGVQLDVSDTGSGIPPEVMPRIFEPLFTTKARGIGLGLAVSRSLAAANGATLTAASRPGEGSTFSLTLPVEGVHA